MSREIIKAALATSRRFFVEALRTLYPPQSKSWRELSEARATAGDPLAEREERNQNIAAALPKHPLEGHLALFNSRDYRTNITPCKN